jgi:hypothetical protein
MGATYGGGHPDPLAKMPKTPCEFHFGLNGKRPGSCTKKGGKCKFSHDDTDLSRDPPKRPCAFHFGFAGKTRGSCTRTAETCMFSHEEVEARKIFTDDHRGPITAAGCLIRRKNPASGLWEYYVVEELTKMTDPLWEKTFDAEGHPAPTKHLSDPGGKAEHADANPMATARREFMEETGLTPPHGPPITGSVYIPESKYIAYVWTVEYDSAPPSRGLWASTLELDQRRISVRLRRLLEIIADLDAKYQDARRDAG